MKFETGIWDAVATLIAGYTCFMIDDEMLHDPINLISQCIYGGVTRMMLTPSLLTAVISSETALALWYGPHCRLTKIVLCGEVAPKSLLLKMQLHLPHVRVLNLYSLSECHDVAFLPTLDFSGCLFPNVGIEFSKTMEDDEYGQVIISGRSLAFDNTCVDMQIENTEAICGFMQLNGQRVFVSSDMGRITPSGTFEVRGRSMDSSLVKIRGSFVSVNKVERLLYEAGRDLIYQCAVVEIDGNIYACIVTSSVNYTDTDICLLWADIILPQLRQLVASPVEIPLGAFSFLMLPHCDSTGKLDRRELSKIVQIRLSQKKITLESISIKSVLSSCCEQVITIFQQFIPTVIVKPESNFFYIGGHSLLCVTLVYRLNEILNIDITIAAFCNDPTPIGVARHCSDKLYSTAPGRMHSSKSCLLLLEAEMKRYEQIMEAHYLQIQANKEINSYLSTKSPEAPRGYLMTGVTGFLGLIL